MQVLIVQAIATSTVTSQMNISITKLYNHNPLAKTLELPKSFLPGFRPKLRSLVIHSKVQVPRNAISASLLENPIIWAARVCVFYALLKAGIAGSHSSPLVSGFLGFITFALYYAYCFALSAPLTGRRRPICCYASDLDLGAAGITDASDLGFSKWLDKLRNNPDKEAADKRKLVSKWHPTTKGTLRRNYRIPSKPEGRRLLKAIAALLSDDDHFVDASSHKGCQIRRESAHGESVCCNNVRALFDELPTPHIIVEITPFPAGSLSEKDYAKAEKLERVLRSSPSV